jgi:hypothetical protein
MILNDTSGVAQAFLSTSTITLSFSILRFQSMWKHTGQLIIMVFEMIKDLGSFLIVFLTVLLGFGIAFGSLFPRLETANFNTIPQTFLTLFDAALGDHDFSIFNGSKIGISLMVLYTVLVMIVLLNLVIARMSATHNKLDDTSLEVWSKIQAVNVAEFVLIFDRNALCMLPAPFNLISIAAYVLEFCFESPIADGSVKIKLSFAGTTSDKITRCVCVCVCVD